MRYRIGGRRAFPVRGSRSETSGGAQGRAYAGMSNDKAGENPADRKPKGSSPMFIRAGLVGT